MLEEAFGSLQGMVDGLGVDFGGVKIEVDFIIRYRVALHEYDITSKGC